MGGTVKLRYDSDSNVSFRGVWDTGIEREDWDEMSWSEKDDIMTDAVHYLVNIYEEEL